MNTDQINELRDMLDRYYAAETTPDEEKHLLDLLSDTDLPEEFLPDRESLSSMASLLPHDGFERRLSERLDSLASKETDKSQKTVKPHSASVIQWFMTAAAAMLIAVTALTRIATPTPHPTPLTPEETYEQATMALMVFSDALNKGYAAIERADATTADASEKTAEALAAIGIYFPAD